MLIPADKDNIRITMVNESTFEAEILFQNSDELDDMELPKILKEIKGNISNKFNIPISQLKYNKMLNKSLGPGGFTATLEIVRIASSQGKPILKFCSATLPNGRTIDNMILLVDLFPLDENGEPNTEESVLKMIHQSGVKPDFVDRDALKQAISTLQGEGVPVEDVMVAKGILPEVGVDARLDFNFPLQPAPMKLREFVSARKAKPDDILCVKIPRTVGEKSGCNLFGEEVKPIAGKDFLFKAGQGTKLSQDQTKIIAQVEGVVVIRKEETQISDMGYSRGFPKEVLLRIDPLVVVESSRTVEIVTKDSVEVQGHLMPDSNIISEGEVYIRGDVQKNSKIHAADNIYIEGSIDNSSLLSSKDIQVSEKVDQSVLSARGRIRIGGTVKNTRLFGEEVEIDRVVSSTIIAGRKAVVHFVESDETEMLSEIHVGIAAYRKMKIHENKEFIEYLEGDLSKMRTFFGESIVKDLTYANTELMFIMFTRIASHGKKLTQQQLEALKQLMESVPSLKLVLREKRKENQRLEQELHSGVTMPAVVVIKERLQSPVRIQIDSTKTQLATGESGVYRRRGDNIIREDLPPE